ncbi:MAG: PrsW family intramembrane metalloprotease [Spirochaetales bacterium]|nr:PrsW family intramembrane metalloprotease [Spirochaetales bacterium]MCF7937896.1 PrsW family intramembrane metalloprotease [Spirochaetales bacterium]
MQLLILIVFLSAAPSLFLLYFFARIDRNKPEPFHRIFQVFLLGFLAVIPAGFIEAGLSAFLPGEVIPRSLPILRTAVESFLVVALVEEGMKLLVVRLSVYRLAVFDELLDGILYTAAAGLGFAFLENFLYGITEPGLLLVRGLTAVPLHAAVSGIMGYWIARDRLGYGGGVLRGLFLAVLFHGLYNFLILAGRPLSLLSVVLTAGLVIGVFRLAVRVRNESPNPGLFRD